MSVQEPNNQSYVPIRFSDVTVWDDLREQAAHLVALNEHTDRQICEALGFEVSDLVRLRSNPTFMERVAEIAEDVRWTLLKQGIANKQNRINALNDRWSRLKQIIFERSQDPTLQDIPGGKTGLITVVWRSGGRMGFREEYHVDTDMLDEMRQVEMQAAKELGQWIEKVSVDQTVKSLQVNVITEIAKYEHAFAQALGQQQAAADEEPKQIEGPK